MISRSCRNLIDAYEFAKERHGEQKRRNGGPYIDHLVGTVDVAISEGPRTADSEVIRACLLHDVVEDTSTTLDEIRKRFGERIAYIVDGVTKMDTEEETIEKIRTYAERDTGVIVVKLADRIHNMLSFSDSVWSEPKNQRDKKRILGKYAKSNPHYIEIGRESGLTCLPYFLSDAYKNIKNGESNRETLISTRA